MPGPPAAKQGDQVMALDTHLIQPPGPSSPVTVPHPFSGILDQSLSGDVKAMGMAAATVGSVATNTPPHIPIGGTFVNPPKNRGEITHGSSSVKINGKAAARAGDPARTCNDPVDQEVGTVIATGTVLVGG